MAPGDPPVLHYDNGDWLLETVDAATLQIRKVGAGITTASMIHPVGNCFSQPVAMATTFNYLAADGETLQAPFCPAPFGAGSTVLVTVADFNTSPPTPVLFRCISTGNNGHVCQRY